MYGTPVSLFDQLRNDSRSPFTTDSEGFSPASPNAAQPRLFRRHRANEKIDGVGVGAGQAEALVDLRMRQVFRQVGDARAQGRGPGQEGLGVRAGNLSLRRTHQQHRWRRTAESVQWR